MEAEGLLMVAVITTVCKAHSACKSILLLRGSGDMLPKYNFLKNRYYGIESGGTSCKSIVN